MLDQEEWSAAEWPSNIMNRSKMKDNNGDEMTVTPNLVHLSCLQPVTNGWDLLPPSRSRGSSLWSKEGLLPVGISLLCSSLYTLHSFPLSLRSLGYSCRLKGMWCGRFARLRRLYGPALGRVWLEYENSFISYHYFLSVGWLWSYRRWLEDRGKGLEVNHLSSEGGASRDETGGRWSLVTWTFLSLW